MSVILSLTLAALIQDAPQTVVSAGPEYEEKQGIYDISFRNQPVAVAVLGADGSYIQVDPKGERVTGTYELKGKDLCYQPDEGEQTCWFQTSRENDGWRKLVNRKNDVEVWMKRREN
ncbi:hypothetical protein WJT74_06935 [Sphingomicrobium sp. XHP0239]|uniref:hypothetical protein n=1 Tax=Sphingomicrobium maritimum TaxID=3133972 RepID=UPI0031CCA5A7